MSSQYILIDNTNISSIFKSYVSGTKALYFLLLPEELEENRLNLEFWQYIRLFIGQVVAVVGQQRVDIQKVVVEQVVAGVVVGL